jgi:hypothetical protein
VVRAIFWVVAASGGGLFGCTHPFERVAETAPAPLASDPRGGPGAPRIPWAQKTRGERVEFMGLYFFPKMKTVFREQTLALPFRCQTCHGENMEEADFRMPNGLHPLPSDDPLKAALAEDEPAARFMVEQVVPTMNELLGKDDARDSARVACLDCHATRVAP